MSSFSLFLYGYMVYNVVILVIHCFISYISNVIFLVQRCYVIVVTKTTARKYNPRTL